MALLPVAALAGTGDVTIDQGNFPDAAFRAYVKQFDTDGDGVLSAAERDSVTEIFVYGGYDGQQIADLTGVEHFQRITWLNCSDNRLTALDVTGNAALEELSCFDNQLTALDVTKNPALTNLDCSGNRLTTLDVTKNAALESLFCANNDLTALDVSRNPALTTLGCFDNQLTLLDVSNNSKLQTLNCAGNRLASLNVAHHPALETLVCDQNRIAALDVSQNPALASLECSDNELTELDVTRNPALTALGCANNHLLSLNLEGRALSYLNCGGQTREIQVTPTASNLWLLSLSDLPGVDPAKFTYLDVAGAGLLDGKDLIWYSVTDRPVIIYNYATGSGDMRVTVSVLPLSGEVDAGAAIPELPQTGDGSHVGLWAALLLVSLCALTALRRRRGTAA